MSFKRLIKIRNSKGFKIANIVIDHARNNSHSYRVGPTTTAVYRFFLIFFLGLPLTGTTYNKDS